MSDDLENKKRLDEAFEKAGEIREKISDNISDLIVFDIYEDARKIAESVIVRSEKSSFDWQTKLDDLLTSRLFGYPIMILLLGMIFWLTIVGANYPSEILSNGFFFLQQRLEELFLYLNIPSYITGILITGVYGTTATVVSVMLPPMAIFFPLFTFLEDVGYLPRLAFNLDNVFKKCKACGKQSLTMCMGFGCNAAGIVACRIIDSPRERLIAIITNNFSPCNGRFPTLIAISSIFIAGSVSDFYNTLISAFSVTVIILLGIAATFLISYLLSITILKGESSSNVLELPPYRKANIKEIIYRSIVDRTLFVLKRAILMAAPIGAIIYILANTSIGNQSVLIYFAALLDHFAYYLGLDGIILLAFVLGLPANEIVLPIMLMLYLATGQMVEVDSLLELGLILQENNWTLLTAINTMLFCLCHYPCSTALLTIYKETGSSKWTLVSFLIPTFLGIFVCFVTASIAHLFLGF